MQKKIPIEKLLPFSLTAFVVALDQITKSYIVSRWPKPGTFIADVFHNDVLHIYHVRNKLIAFSLGQSLPENLRPFLFILLPIVVLIFLGVYFFRSSDCTMLQRWAIAGILGGGAGTLIDRIFRPDGVVDFISVKFYGLFGFERWPTFNVSDSAIVICVGIWFVTMFLPVKTNAAKEANGKNSA
ncbi:MAG: signal peptidase II [Spirochaetaceae bacterium]|jgi:signal peptidase II|nr:signal peptidase II [Spirochaetaceae bacterium]